MAKRFTQTEIWNEDWFIDLPVKYKLFWFYLKDVCNHGGIWRPNRRLFEAMVEVKVDLNEALKLFNAGKERVQVLESGHWFLLDFFVFQYGETFNSLNRLHKSVQNIYNQENISLTSIRGLKDLKEGVKDKDKDKDKDSYSEKGMGKTLNKELTTIEEIQEGKESKELKLKTWRTDFEVYLSGCTKIYQGLLLDTEYISCQEKFNPNVDIRLSLEKSYKNFWGTEAGWKHKKKSRSNEIDWKSTFTNAIGMNKVFKNTNYIKKTESTGNPLTYRKLD